MNQQTLRVVVREDEVTGDVHVTQSDKDEEAGREYLERQYPDAIIERLHSKLLDQAPFIFWKVRKG